tara:strand:- start:536 stop:727 length:192 start_codon:yes stop_codon:yes gene_type:complete
MKPNIDFGRSSIDPENLICAEPLNVKTKTSNAVEKVSLAMMMKRTSDLRSSWNQKFGNDHRVI